MGEEREKTFKQKSDPAGDVCYGNSVWEEAIRYGRAEERKEETAQGPGQRLTYVRGKKELKGKGAKMRDGWDHGTLVIGFDEWCGKKFKIILRLAMQVWEYQSHELR